MGIGVTSANMRQIDLSLRKGATEIMRHFAIKAHFAKIVYEMAKRLLNEIDRVPYY